MKFGAYTLGWKQFGQYGFWPAFGASAFGQGTAPTTAIHQRNNALVRDRAGQIIQVRS